MIDKYISYISSVRRYSARTQQIYRSVLESFFSYADKLDVNNVRNYEVWLLDEKKLTPRTVNLHMSVLSGYASFLIKQGALQSNPVRLTTRPKQEKRLPEFFREEAMEAYFSSTRGVPEFGSYRQQVARIIISILYNTGIRRAELIGLRRSSFDPERGKLNVLGKGDKMRQIPLLPGLCKEISLYLQKVDSKFQQLDKDACLILTENGGPLYPVYVDRLIKQELGNVDGISGRKSPHVLRHSIATELLDEGADLNSIKEMLGHSSLAATQVYTHNSIEKLKTVYNNAHPRAKNGGNNGNQN